MKKIPFVLAMLLSAFAFHANAQKLVGGDISLLPSYEEKGAQYFDHDGNAIPSLLPYLKEQGWNAMRVRLFVEPANATDAEKKEGVVQDLDYVKSLAKRIKDEGLQLVLDFHYSDTWADPSKQWTPNDWLSLDDDALGQQLYSYTKEVLQQLKDSGCAPDYIQTGNEISFGMLWGERGTTDNHCYINSPEANWNRFTSLLQQATKACREVCPEAKIILHSERSCDSSVLLDFLSRMKSAEVDYDVLGLSYYPYYHGALSTLSSTLTQVENSYSDKNIMIVETGYPAHYAIDGSTYDFSSTYPYTDEGQKKFTDDLITTLNGHANVKGLFWWWPEANEYGIDWQNAVTSKWYNSTLFDNQTGCAYSALSELKNFVNDPTGITTPSVVGQNEDNNGFATRQVDNQQCYNLQGMVIAHPQGLYINNGKKILAK
ncbi:MAG: glycosyl hydrolase 53 family protein [Prevotella sp.]|jgi:arabinogalactan endo-1,4-beta-galactosidase